MAWSSVHSSTYHTNSFQILDARFKVCGASCSLQQLVRSI